MMTAVSGVVSGHILARLLLRPILSRLSPITHGQLELPGIERRVSIVRDRWGIPHVRAATSHDAWFAIGFCQAQDRTFQLEFLRRLVRGELAALVGPAGLPFDRLARRVGFRRASLRQLPTIAGDVRDQVEAFLAGMRAGLEYGLRVRPIEFLFLRADPRPWDAADVLALVKFLSFVLASNWTSELVRLRVLLEDGVESLRALDPAGADVIDLPAFPTELRSEWVEHVSAELDRLRGFGSTAASNNWVVAGSRTQSGRPLLANDPHWSPLLPSFWYLAHLSTPEWSIAGATLIGTPAFLAGHNGYAAWGVTAGFSDNTDLAIEMVGPDGCSVREKDDFVPCRIHQESIAVRGHGTVNDLVLETRRGPIVSPVLRGVPWAVSLRAVWLDPLPVRGLLSMHRARSFDDCRTFFADWPHLPLNVVYADCSDQIGWLLAGTVPQRRCSTGLFPLLGWENPDPWIGYVSPDRMPCRVDPPEGFLATANNRPTLPDNAPWLGTDYLDSYRIARVTEVLGSRTDWRIEDMLVLQLDAASLSWRELRDIVLAVEPTTSRLQRALQLLREWNGTVDAADPAATVFEIFVHRLAQELARAYAPRSWRWVIGAGFHDLVDGTSWGVRRIAHLVRALHDSSPPPWCGSWPAMIAEVLEQVIEELEHVAGDDVADWAWGKVRPLHLRHPLGAVGGLRWLFDRGPFPISGDENTVNPGGVSAHDPLGPVQFIASLRFVVEVGSWDRARVSLPGGQSGHPFSFHYDDLLAYWLRGETIPFVWSEDAIARVARDHLVLVPAR